MKRLVVIVASVLMLIGTAFAQHDILNKITPELQKELDSRTAANEQFRIIIMMADQYDQNVMARQIQYIDKVHRREFVVNELQKFAKTNQHELLQLLEESAKKNTVKDLTSFWIFNGISCVTNRETVAWLAQRKDIRLIESDELRNMLPQSESPVRIKEQKYALAWHVSRVHANNVWSYNGSTGYDGSGVVVAIIDTGVNYNHADLADHMWYPVPGSLGDTLDGYPGYDFANKDKNPLDDNGHGTHCAGIAAGDGTSGTMTGIAPNASIMAIKVMNASGTGSSDLIMNAIQFAIANGANVVSMSLGGPGEPGSDAYREIFFNMMNAGVVASVCAGNDGEKYRIYAVPVNVESPGSCPPPWHNPDQTLTGGLSAVVTVGASNRNDRKATFSSFGPCTWTSGNSGNYLGDYNDYPYTAGNSTEIGLIKPDIIAPGVSILSCSHSNNTGHVLMSGTSMATPLVSGIMALMLQADPTLSPTQIDSLLETTAVPVDFKITKNNYTGAGRADALAAIDAIFTTATQPTNLSLCTRGGDVCLTWTASTSAPLGYKIYCDNELLNPTETIYETTYTDKNAGTGKHIYYVRAIDDNHRQSIRSNAVICYIEPYATIPENLTVSYDDAEAVLDWDASSTKCNEVTSKDLYFTLSPTTFYNKYVLNKTNFWGIKYEPEELRRYEGMSIDQISVGINATSLTHTIRIYRGTLYGNTTGAPVFTQSFTPTCRKREIQTITLETPYLLDDISEDLWITCSVDLGNGVEYPVVIDPYNGFSSNCFYWASEDNPNSIIWNSVSRYAACIKAHLTRTTYYTPTYNVYFNNESEANELSEATYTDNAPTLYSGDNTYYVTSQIVNNESFPSNDAKIVVIDNAQTENSLAIDESLVYLIENGGTLTVSDTLTNTDPNRLVIKDGGQLVNNSQDVQATMQKDIEAYTADGGWYTIASPFVSYDPAAELTTTNYDLYGYNEAGNSEGMEWINYKSDTFDLTSGAGYLYAHNPTVTVAMRGTLNSGNYTQTVDLSYANNKTSIKGYNLLGNPTAHSISYSKTSDVSDGYYYLANDSAWTYTTETTVPAGRGFLVKANAADQSVTLNPQNRNETVENGQYIFLSIGDATTYIKLNKGVSMPLLDFKGSHSNFYLTFDHQPYVMLVRDGADAIDLRYEPIHDGTQTLTVDTQGLGLDYLHLIDNLTNEDIDLLATPNYTFEAKTTDDASRFRLVFVHKD